MLKTQFYVQNRCQFGTQESNRHDCEHTATVKKIKAMC